MHNTGKSLLTSIIVPLMAAAVIIFAADRQSHAEGLSGTITETMDAAGYTYILLDTTSDKIWVAIPETEVITGKEISVKNGMEMKDFHSNSLDKTFASIIFSPGLVGAKPASPHGKSKKTQTSGSNSFADAVEAERGAAPEAQTNPGVEGSAGSQGAIAPFADLQVEKAGGDNSYTVAEIFEKAAELDGQKVRIRGQVVKFNANIMGRNWLHLQDGSGDPMQNTHDLVATTTDLLDTPRVIVVEGTVAHEKDFGAGYKYAVILEECTIVE